MIITDADRREVLARYRRIRTSSPVPPVVAMQVLADSIGDTIRAVLLDRCEPDPRLIRQWQAATDYRHCMYLRPAYWRRWPA